LQNLVNLAEQAVSRTGVKPEFDSVIEDVECFVELRGQRWRRDEHPNILQNTRARAPVFSPPNAGDSPPLNEKPRRM